MEQDFRFVVLATSSPARPFPNCQPDATSFRLMKCHPGNAGSLDAYFARERAANREIRHGNAHGAARISPKTSEPQAIINRTAKRIKQHSTDQMGS